MFENIRLAFQGVWSHKMRSFLTMLGIIIGIAAIIAIVSTIQGTNEQLQENLIGAGNNSIDVQLYKANMELTFDYESIPKGVPVITESVRKQMLEVEGVENVTCYNSRSYADSIYYLDNSLQGAKMLGIDQNYFATCGYVVRTGRQFLDEDYSSFHKVIIVDQDAASNLFQEENPIGKTLEIKGEPYTIVGVAQKKDEFQPVINSQEEYYEYYGEDAYTSGTIFMPSAAWSIAYQYDEPQNVIVKAESTDYMTTVGKRCAEIVNANLSVTDTDIKYKAEDVMKNLEAKQKASEAANTQLIWIASISLLVGGIGVMNIMLVSVTERTSEIGLKKAIGAKKKYILGQFLTEAVVLTSTGGFIGVLAGIGLSRVISKMADIPVGISVPAIILSVIFSMLIGVIFGLLPSVKAANLNPIDALRHE